MSQKREPPAYLEYAAAMMARIEYRIMSLAQRGLMDSMRRECWVNYAVPADPDLLAKVLGFPTDEIKAALPAVMPFFMEMEGRLICPELENYRTHLIGIRERQSAGGKHGAAITNSKPKPSKRKAGRGKAGESSGNSSSDPQVDPRVKSGSLVKYSSVQSSSVQTNKPLSSGTSNLSSEDASWAAEYEKASNGN